MPEPSNLPLGVAAGVAPCRVRRVSHIDLTAEMPNEPRHAMRFHGGQGRIEVTRMEHPHLLQRAGREHGIKARINAAIELRAIDCEEYLYRVTRMEHGLHAV